MNWHNATNDVSVDLSSTLLIPEGENKKHLCAQNVDLNGVKNVSSLIPDCSLLIGVEGMIKTNGEILCFS